VTTLTPIKEDPLMKAGAKSTDNLIALHPLSEYDALEWLRAGKRITASGEELARRWGWDGARVRRRLEAWNRAGYIRRRGKTITVVEATTAALPTDVLASRAVALLPIEPQPILLVAVVFLLGLGVAATGLWLNTSFWHAFGRSAEAGYVLAAIGLAMDGMTLLLPTVVASLWARRRVLLAIIALVVYVATVGMTLLASIGFAQTNIGDAVSGRGSTAQQRAALHEEIGRLKIERSALPRFAPTTAEAVAAATATRDRECGRRSGLCTRAGGELAALLRDKAITDRVGTIDARLGVLSDKLATLPALGSADPQVDGARAAISWVSRGAVAPTAGDIEMVRLLGIAAMPVLGGLLLAFAAGLVPPRRRL
jgi:hypothetical protein